MGPDGGDGGGTVVAQGTPEQLTKVPGSYTGQYLKAKLRGGAAAVTEQVVVVVETVSS
jgi:excinuclease ABC subunit A